MSKNKNNTFSGTTKKIFSQVALGFFNLKITIRSNNLKYKDYLRSRKLITKGDIVLVGDFKPLSGLFMGKYFTHSLLYIGAGKCIHAGPSSGVRKILFRKIFKKYDTCMILRPNIVNNHDKVVDDAIDFAQRQLGKPFDFFLEANEDSYFCTNLINCSFSSAGFDTGIQSNKEVKKGIVNIFGRIKKVARADHFMKANFSKVFVSEDLENNKLMFSFKKMKKRFSRY